MRITISGPPGSGTTTLALFLVEKHAFDFISAGEVFRTLAAEHDMTLAEFGNLCENDPAFDRLIDERQKEMGEARDHIVIEGRLAGHMIENADLRIWVNASVECRAGRVSDREELSYEEAYIETAEREACEIGRYMKYYQIDITDLSLYDLVVSSEAFGKEELATIVDCAICQMTSE